MTRTRTYLFENFELEKENENKLIAFGMCSKELLMQKHSVDQL